MPRFFLFAAILALALTIPGAPATSAAFSLFDRYTSVEAKDGAVKIPIKDIDDGKAHYFQFKDQGKAIKFFVLKSKDGALRSAFDACDVCFPEKKGYTQDGDSMVCNNCGQKFHSNRVNEIKGGCNPASLNRTWDQEHLIVKVADIQSGAKYF